MAVTSREDLKEYCLRALGKPVIDINVADEQLEDRIDEALQFWQEYHYDAAGKVYLKHTITQTDIDNKYITIPDSVLAINRVLERKNSQNFGDAMWDPEYQMYFNGFGTTENPAGVGAGYNIVDFEMSKQYLAMIDMLLTGMSTPITHTRHKDRVELDVAWQTRIKVGQMLVFDTLSTVDPAEYPKVWSDAYLKHYTTALFKRQWGQNLQKFENMQLPGGMTMNGRQIYDDAIADLNELKEDMDLRYSLPPDFFVG